MVKPHTFRGGIDPPFPANLHQGHFNHGRTWQRSRLIAHELAHLLEPNHTTRFWNIVKTQITHFDKAKGWLKEYGEVLEFGL